jgi:signal transduction histidine kinase
MADRLMALERRVAALDQLAQETLGRTQAIEQASRDLLAMFDALLQALPLIQMTEHSVCRKLSEADPHRVDNDVLVMITWKSRA